MGHQSLGEEGGPRCLAEAAEELSSQKLAAVAVAVAGQPNTGSKQHNFGSHHMQHKDRRRHSTGHSNQRC